MTSLTDESASRSPTHSPLLPPLTEAVVQRAREGLAAAHDRHARAAVETSLVNGEAVAEGKPEYRINGVLRRNLLGIFINAMFRVRVEHADRIPTGPVMLAPNHLNHIDPFFVLSQLPAHPYYYVLGDARTMYNKAWKRWMVRRIGGVIPLDRIWKEEMAVIEAAKDGHPELAELAADIERDVPTGGSLDVLRRIDRIIQGIFARRDCLVIFPEGGLGTQEGHLRVPLKRGTVMYAMRAGVPIVPVGLIGNRDLFLRKELTIRFGEPLLFPQDHRPKPRAVQVAVESLETAIQGLIDPNYHEPTGRKPFNHLLNHMFW